MTWQDKRTGVLITSQSWAPPAGQMVWYVTMMSSTAVVKHCHWWRWCALMESGGDITLILSVQLVQMNHFMLFPRTHSSHNDPIKATLPPAQTSSVTQMTAAPSYHKMTPPQLQDVLTPDLSWGQPAHLVRLVCHVTMVNRSVVVSGTRRWQWSVMGRHGRDTTLILFVS